jgi:hypothetical protein
MIHQPSALPAPPGGVPVGPAVLLGAAVIACSVYANLSFLVTDPADYRFFPPFRRGVDVNANRHLGGEYLNMARSLVAGEGFAHPFEQCSGPTAWQPPVLPLILAGLFWACDGNRSAVAAVVVCLQVWTLMGTGFLVMALARQTAVRLGTAAAGVIYFLLLLSEFRLCFQFTQDNWLVLLAVDLLIAGACWARPLARWTTAVAWGLFGGLCALINPIVGVAWGVLSVPAALRRESRARFAAAVLAAGLALAPWTVRNYVVLGRLIPTKSNLAYELYQSQCLQPDGLLQNTTFSAHPYRATRAEGREYQALGETAYLDRKWEQFREAVRADPMDYADRVATRFLGTALWYVPFNRSAEANPPWMLWPKRLAYPLPFLGLLVLVFAARRECLPPAVWVVMGVYLLYLLPYIAASYYERYSIPLLGAKALLVLWAADRLLAWRN